VISNQNHSTKINIEKTSAIKLGLTGFSVSERQAHVTASSGRGQHLAHGLMRNRDPSLAHAVSDRHQGEPRLRNRRIVTMAFCSTLLGTSRTTARSNGLEILNHVQRGGAEHAVHLRRNHNV